MKYELGIIGAGNMAEAILRAVLESRLIAADQLIVSDPAEGRRQLFADLGIHATDSNEEVAANASQIMLAIKPQALPTLTPLLKSLDPDKQIVQSIMAGITTRKLEELSDHPLRVIRIMPNTPLIVGLGMSGIAMGQHAQPGDEALALKLFRAAGEAVMVEEAQLDAITAVSGSGPAYIYYLAEAMAEAASSLHLPEEMVDLLTRQTILGAAQLLKQSKESAAELRRRVTSPGGTTQAALEYMESQNVRSAIAEGVRRAESRSRELGA